jgi:hypothetical protein
VIELLPPHQNLKQGKDMANPEWRKHLEGGTYTERRDKARKKEAQILEFLSVETYSDSKNLALLIGLGVQSAKITLTKMEAKGLLTSVVISLGGRGVGIKYWGITQQGLLEQAQEESVVRLVHGKHFVPSMVNVITVPHKFAAQTVILQRRLTVASGVVYKGIRWTSYPSKKNLAYESGWVHYRDRGMDLSAKNIKKLIIPDLIFKESGESDRGQHFVFAVEVELTIKTAKRYKAIFEGHYRNSTKAKLYDVVIYVLATKKERLVFNSMINRIFGKELDDKFKEFISKAVLYTSLEEIKHSASARKDAQSGV